MAMNACENFHKQRHPKKVVLEKDFAGVKAGQTLYIGTPQIVAEYIERLEAGESVSIRKLRNQIAREHGCNAMCPVSTAIFLRIVAEYAIDQIKDGKALSDVVPFWRAIAPSDKVASKLSMDTAWLAEIRLSEGILG